MAQGRSNRSTTSVAIVGIASLVLVMPVIAVLLPQMRAWGFNHLSFLPAGFTWAYVLLSAGSLILLFKPGYAAQVYNAAAGFTLGDQNWRKWWIIAGLFSVIFWLFRLPVFLLGDSYSAVANISNDLPVIYKWSEIGAIVIVNSLAQLVSGLTDNPGLLSYNIIAVLSGGVTVLLFLAIAYESGNNQRERMLVFGLSICAGWVLLFFGYTENYPVLWPFVTGYIFFSLRYLNKKGSLIVPAVFLLAALILHLQILFFLFSFAIVLFSHGKPANFYYRFKKSMIAGYALVILMGVILFAWLYQNSLEFRIYIIPLLGRSGISGEYSLLSLRHLADIGNQFIILMPIFPVLLVAGWQGWKKLTSDKINQFLLLLTLGSLAFLLLIDPKLGMGRDWDLFALAGLPPMLLLARGIIAKSDKLGNYFPVIIIILLTTIMPFFAVNLDYNGAITKYEFLLNLDSYRSRSGITSLREHYLAQGNIEAVDSLNEVLVSTFPSTRLAPLAYNLIAIGRFDEAKLLIDSMAILEPNAIDVYNLRGTYYLKLGRMKQAIDELQIAARLGRYDSRPLVNLAQAYSQTHQFDKMMTVLRDAQARNPGSILVAEGLATGFYALAQYDSALVYSVNMIESDPAQPLGYYYAGFSAYNMGDKQTASRMFTRFLELAPSHLQASQVKEIMRMMK